MAWNSKPVIFWELCSRCKTTETPMNKRSHRCDDCDKEYEEQWKEMVNGSQNPEWWQS